jgi:acetyltransferase-like isoleucine patch superfamily enzyme
MASEPANDAPHRLIADDVVFGENVVVQPFTNLYGCRIGDDSRIGPFVEIQSGATVGRRCKIQSHSFICEGVVIEDEVFVGHGVMFINDKYPRAANERNELKSPSDWQLAGSTVGRGGSIGSGAIILGGLRLGAFCMIGAGSVVTRDVPAGAVAFGNPARVRG